MRGMELWRPDWVKIYDDRAGIIVDPNACELG